MTLVIGILGLLLAGCASRGTAEKPEVNDPLEPMNRVFYRINDVGDRYLLRPVAVGYKRALPNQFQSGINNFFSNLMSPVTIANGFLQGKFSQVMRDGARFLLNSTVGLAGLFDPATRVGLEKHDENFDQTLGRWGVPPGAYLVVPVFGPYTVRSAAGELVDLPLSPFVNMPNGNVEVTWGAWLIYAVDRRSRFLDVDQQVFESFDPYVFVRDAYLQNQRYRVLDGNVPEEEIYPDEEFDDESAPDDDSSGKDSGADSGNDSATDPGNDAGNDAGSDEPAPAGTD